MAKELTANFSASTGGFSSGIAKLKSDLTNFNKALDDNKRAVSEANKEIRQLEKQKQQLDEAMKNGATKEQAEQMERLETALAQAKVKAAALKTEQAELKVDIKNATKSLEEQKNAAEDNSKSLDKIKESAADLGKTITAVASGFAAVVGALGAMTASAGATADDINTLSKQYGLSAEQIQKFKYATDLIDVSLNTYTASIARNIRSMTAYQNGTALTVQAYDNLGVAVLDSNGALRDSETVYNEVIAALGKIDDETKRDSISLTLLGRSALELNPLILGGAEALAELGEQAESLGLILPQEQLDSLNAFNDKVDTLKANLNALKLVGAESFADSFDSLFEAGDDFVDFINQLKADGTLDEMAKGLSDTLASVVGLLKNAITWGWEFRNVIAAGAVALVTFKTAMSIGNIIAQTTLAIKSFSAANKAATVSQQMLNTAMNANPYVLVTSLVLSLVGAMGTFAVMSGDAADGVERLSSSLQSAVSSAQSYADKTATLNNIIEDYKEISENIGDTETRTEELIAVQETLVNTFGNVAQGIDLVNGKYEEQLALLQALNEDERARKINEITSQLQSVEEEIKGLSANSFQFDFQFTEDTKARIGDKLSQLVKEVNADSGIEKIAIPVAMSGDSGSIGVIVQGMSIDEQISTYKELLEIVKSTGEQTGSLSATYDVIYDRLAKLQEIKTSRDSLKQSLDLLNGATVANTNANKENLSVTQSQVKTIAELNEMSESNKKATRELVTEQNRLTSALKEQNEAGQLSLATAMDLIDSGYSSVLAIDNETGAIRLNIEAYRQLNEAKIEAQKQALLLERRELRLANAHLGTMAATAAQGREFEKLAEIQRQIAENDRKIKELDATSAVLGGMGATGADTSYSTGTTSSGESKYTAAYNAYKTEADKKLELINRELEAKRKLRDETISAINDEIAARKRLNEDENLEKEINAITAQLKYSQLDEFSRAQLQNRLNELYDEQSELQWQRQMEDRKAEVNEQYAIAEEQLKATQVSINESIATFKAIMDALSKGITNINNVVNNSSTSNNTANVSIASSALTEAQITAAIKKALMDDIVI